MTRAVRAPLRRLDSTTAELTWDAARHPLVIVRDAASGDVLAFARGGRAAIPTATGEVELLYSDGAQSSSRRLPVP